LALVLQSLRKGELLAYSNSVHCVSLFTVLLFTPIGETVCTKLIAKKKKYQNVPSVTTFTLRVNVLGTKSPIYYGVGGSWQHWYRQLLYPFCPLISKSLFYNNLTQQWARKLFLITFSLSPNNLYFLFHCCPAKLFSSMCRKTLILNIVRKCVPWNWRHDKKCWEFRFKPSGRYTNHLSWTGSIYYRLFIKFYQRLFIKFDQKVITM